MSTQNLTVEDIQNKLKRIKNSAWDYDIAHSLEDRLYAEVLQSIANGAKNPRKLARKAIKSQEIKFSRYTA